MWLLGTSISVITRTETGVPGKPVPSFAKSLRTVLDRTFPGLTECEGEWTNQDPPSGLLRNVEICCHRLPKACHYVSAQHLPTTGRPSLLHIDFASLATPHFVKGIGRNIDAEQATTQTQQLARVHLQRGGIVGSPGGRAGRQKIP